MAWGSLLRAHSGLASGGEKELLAEASLDRGLGGILLLECFGEQAAYAPCASGEVSFPLHYGAHPARKRVRGIEMRP